MHQNIGSLPFGTVRISISYFTTSEEIEVFKKAIFQIIDEFK